MDWDCECGPPVVLILKIPPEQAFFFISCHSNSHCVAVNHIGNPAYMPCATTAAFWWAAPHYFRQGGNVLPLMCLFAAFPKYYVADFHRTCCLGVAWAKEEPIKVSGSFHQHGKKTVFFYIEFGASLCSSSSVKNSVGIVILLFLILMYSVFPIPLFHI